MQDPEAAGGYLRPRGVGEVTLPPPPSFDLPLLGEAEGIWGEGERGEGGWGSRLLLPAAVQQTVSPALIGGWGFLSLIINEHKESWPVIQEFVNFIDLQSVNSKQLHNL